ncbi:PREDICTED: EGF-like and EMI domain-containing protein 1 [Bison bison bison]|uniref:EGF-like and EMI domain-containing protein 1 n=1 Tax=Bison bison bison TaxID=43346 RepID=A0A6P3H4Q4_BISBB|nr:PREDICTED: EGF-like and EMI domain-containing protein 1 [Bison bison bison]
MTWRLWLWCFCAWVAAGWPPGSALQLRPGMPNVCEEEQLTVVGLRRPCVQAFTHTIKIWKQGCTSPQWCVGYERRTRYYTIYRQAYSLEQQTVYKCCPGWSRWDNEPGCLCSVSAVETCVHGKRCSEGEVQRCQCSEGFQGPHCQYDINECSSDNGGCQDQCYNTIGSYYCKCQAGQKLEEDDRGCRDVDECAVVNGGCQQRCINTLGTFHCECDTGYRLHADERTCIRIELEIVNSCEKNNGGCSHHCEHAVGGPRCSCNHGHRLDSDEKTCIDLDECDSGDACCAQFCINYSGGYECSCQEGFQISSDGCGCDALDDELEEEEELDIVKFPALLFKSPPQLLHYVATSLPLSHEDEDHEEQGHDIPGELTDLHNVVCLDNTFGHECSLSCEDCMNGGRCQEGKSGCSCPDGWGGILCNESLHVGKYSLCLSFYPPGCPKGFFGKNCKRKCNCANNGHCHSVYGACLCEPGRYGRFCHLNCPKGAYGAGCSSECQCVEENTLECSARNGSCTCKSGYQGNRCQRACPDGLWGSACQFFCGPCENGVCPPGTYGKDCKQVCQCSAENEECHPVTGRCTCLPGYHGNRCHLRCPRGTYGPYCRRKCKCLNGGSCDTMIGTCDCLPGFIGADCSQISNYLDSSQDDDGL